ncbi:MAG: fluoride efflux transporter FluC [Pseudonocardia sp.]
MTPLLVVLGAAVGAPLRYLVHRGMGGSPWGTFVVNVAGSALIGVLAGAAVSPATLALLGTGFCGALTTYSTFGVETVELARSRWALAVLNALGSTAACLAAAALGVALGSAVVTS